MNNSTLAYNLVGAATVATLPAAGVTGTGTLSVTADTIVLNGSVTHRWQSNLYCYHRRG